MEIGDVIKDLYTRGNPLCKIIGIGDTIMVLDSYGNRFEKSIDAFLKRYILVRRSSDNFNIFERVLVRNNNLIWRAREYEGMTPDGKYMTTSGETWDQCIPYNSWLLGTCLDPSSIS